MTKFFLRWAVNAVALYAAIALLQGHGLVPQNTNWLSFIWLALIFGLVNALLRPLLTILTCPLIILTLGLGTLLINTLLFYLAGLIGTRFGVGFTVDSFWTAFLGALIVTVISFVLNVAIREDRRKRRHTHISSSQSSHLQAGTAGNSTPPFLAEMGELDSANLLNNATRIRFSCCLTLYRRPGPGCGPGQGTPAIPR